MSDRDTQLAAESRQFEDENRRFVEEALARLRAGRKAPAKPAEPPVPLIQLLLAMPREELDGLVALIARAQLIHSIDRQLETLRARRDKLTGGGAR